MALSASVVVSPPSSSNPSDFTATVTVTNTDGGASVDFNPAPFDSSSVVLEVQDGANVVVLSGPPHVPFGGESPVLLAPNGSPGDSVAYDFPGFMPDADDLSPGTYHIRVNTQVEVPFGLGSDTPLVSVPFDITIL